MRTLSTLSLAALAAAATLTLVPAPGLAVESPRAGSFDFTVGPYRPNVDGEPGLRGRPWASLLGSSRPWLLRAGLSYDLTHAFGSLEAGLQLGYLQKSGFAQSATGGASGDTTAFKMIPTSAVLTYRFDWLADRFNVPLAPYGKVAFERYNWWITKGSGSTAKYGATNGWSATLGLALLLDFFDPTLARELDRESGINHTYLTAEARKTKVDDFGSKKSWDLSDTGKFQYDFGILFVF